MWKAITPPPADYTHKFLLSFEQHLLAVRKKSAYVYSPNTESWALMDENSSFRLARYAITFTDHILFRTLEYWCKATLKVSPYDPDSQFSKSALSRLEAAGIPVLTSLEKVDEEKLSAVIGVHYPSDFDVLEEWASGETTGTRPPNWRTLYEVLRELDLEELCKEIEEYLSGPRSLKEQCTSAIVSVLLQQRSLEPDQLHVRLPDYVPPRVKRSITDVFRAHTLQPPPPSPSPPPSKTPRLDEQ